MKKQRLSELERPRTRPRTVFTTTESQLALVRGGKWYVPELDSFTDYYPDLDGDGFGDP